MKKRGLLISLTTVATLLVWLAAAPSARAEPGESLVVVELYTSQGCSSCPAADAFLGELLEMRSDVLGLEFHVDYWDNLGWKDLFSSAELTARQRAYAKRLGLSYVFTPQMVIDGSASEVGSNKMAVMTAIENARARSAARLDISVTQDANGGLKVSLPAGTAGGGEWAASPGLTNPQCRRPAFASQPLSRYRSRVPKAIPDKLFWRIENDHDRLRRNS